MSIVFDKEKTTNTHNLTVIPIKITIKNHKFKPSGKDFNYLEFQLQTKLIFFYNFDKKLSIIY